MIIEPKNGCSNQRAPESNEYFEYYANYVRLVPTTGDISQLAESQCNAILDTLDPVSESEAEKVHAPNSWTLKQVCGHLIDAERIFADRLHRFAAGDLQALPGMDQDPYIANQDFQTPTIASLVNELVFCRRGNLLLLRRVKPSAWDNQGVASGHPVTVRALAYILVGHIEHHLNVIKKRLGKQ